MASSYFSLKMSSPNEPHEDEGSNQIILGWIALGLCLVTIFLLIGIPMCLRLRRANLLVISSLLFLVCIASPASATVDLSTCPDGISISHFFYAKQISFISCLNFFLSLKHMSYACRNYMCWRRWHC